MLAYYSSLIKKESILDRIREEAGDLAQDINEVASDINSVSHACERGDLECALDMIKKAEEASKESHAMIVNLKGNLESYINSLVPDKDIETKPVYQEELESKKSMVSNPDLSEISMLAKAIKELKEMQESIPK